MHIALQFLSDGQNEMKGGKHFHTHIEQLKCQSAQHFIWPGTLSGTSDSLGDLDQKYRISMLGVLFEEKNVPKDIPI